MGLTANEISLILAGRTVLDGVSAQLERGRVTAILGPNGAGKTSLLRTLIGLTAPSSGTAMLDDQPIAAIPPAQRARRIGYLAQNAPLAWNVIARDVVALGRSPYRAPFAAAGADDRAAIDAAIAATDLTRLADRPTGELSGGERARVMLARVLAGTPEWLVADEPLASLDPAHQVDVLLRLRAVADAGSGVILVLHDLTHAARIADDIVLMRNGRVVAAGVAASVLTGDWLRQAYDIDFRIVETGRDRVIVPVR
ncbi:MAG: ABC transporter [Sphingomonas sp. SCN 67-18]|uniref:ABC transporter ATP-binding protein n=1 Tax=uncultured Sphingomonas sp. TaxID=158754 RepID=UPI00086E4EA6|nr:ABC transporter ATP-binding protein [Sphingomonas sp. SCN 67-18]ODU20713.1 MAG: ABC transporter [Sphingomonas sp. SCN 67-18]